MVEACVIDSMTRRAVQLYLAQSIALYVAHGRGEMEIKALLMLLLGFVSVSSQDSPCIEEYISNNGTDVSLGVTCSSFTPVVSYRASGIVPGDGNDIAVSIGYTCRNSTGAVIADDYIASSAIAPTKTKTLPTSFTTGTECTFSGCYFIAKILATEVVFHSLAIPPTPCIVDFDECLFGTHNCDVNAECVNTLGSFQCQCRFGYAGNGTQCTNIDECIESEYNCSAKAKCIDTEGSYNCTCETGYEGNGFTCTNIDECIESEHNCSANANCTDTEGSYNCTCEPGYEGSGFTCTKIRVCTEACSENAFCMEEEQSYECVCKQGFTGDGYICNPITECSECDVNAVCVNAENTYTCVCDEGYNGNGSTCSPRSTKDSKPWIPGLSSMAVVAVVIVIMALGVLFVCGKRKPLLQIAECISCTKQKGLIGYYDEDVDPNYIPVDPEKRPYDRISLEPPEILYRLEPSSIDEDTRRSTTCLTELKMTANPSGQEDDQNKTPAWVIPIDTQSTSGPNTTSSTTSSNSTSDDSITIPINASPSSDCGDSRETRHQFVRIKNSRLRITALPSVTGDESGFAESDTEGYMYIPTSSSYSECYNESDQKELSDVSSIRSGLSNIHMSTDSIS